MFITGVRCDVCGTIEFYEDKVDKITVFKMAKVRGWTIIRKSGMRLERTYCPSHGGKEYRKEI